MINIGRRLQRILVVCTFLVGLLWAGPSHAQDAARADQAVEAMSDWESVLQALLTIPPLRASTPAPLGSFYTVQNGPNWPPLPGNPWNLPFWKLADGFYILDDRNWDYAALKVAVDAAADEEGIGKGGMMAMARTSNSSINSGAGVYLTNHVATPAGGSMTASFNIAGGTNLIPYDIWMTTNLANSVSQSQWTWLGIGYSSNSYTFTNQPLDLAFYVLARPQQTMALGWGNNEVGQVDVPLGLTNAVMMAGGGGQSLALLKDGTVRAWGQNAYGQADVPTNLVGVTMIAAGWYHNVALLTNGSVTAWGLNASGLGWNLTNVPPNLTNAVVISAQARHSLALRNDGTVVGWGDNSAGVTNVPSGLSNVVAIAAGYLHNLAVKSDGTVVAWGDNGFGQTTVPSGLSNVVDVAAGPWHSVALKNDGTVIAWGGTLYGETNLPGLSNVVAIAAGGDPFNIFPNFYTLALKSDGTVVATGIGAVLAPVGGLSNVISIANGADHALAIRSGPATPVITLQPWDQYQLAGSNVTFTAQGAGRYGVTYQWRTNGVNLAGATNATLTLTNVQAAQEGVYNVMVSNEVGSMLSTNASLSLVGPPVIISKTTPTNQAAIYQQNLTLSVVATGLGESSGFPLGYQWKFNGTNIAGATASSYTMLGNLTSPGTYSVTVTNAAGSVSTSWTVTMTYTGSYVDVGTLAYHLSTNAVARTNGVTVIASAQLQLSGWSNLDPATYTGTNMAFLTNAVWSTNFWLKGAQGLSATCIGYSNGFGAKGLFTMVSPRHYLKATHTGPPLDLIAFLDTNNVIYWRTTVQQVSIGNDTDVGVLNTDLPSSVGFLPVIPTNFSTCLPTNSSSYVQGIGMNQDMRVFGQPMTFENSIAVNWNPTANIPFGLGTNWNVAIRGGDSSNPERFLVNNQLVLVTQHHSAGDGPNLAYQFNAINQQMHYLSTNNSVGTDYQLTPFSMTNWPSIH